MNFLSLYIYPFPCSRPRNSGEWDELAFDVTSGITIFCFWEECMRTCDSVCQKSLQNARKICCWRLQQYRMRRIEYSSSLNTSISMKLYQKREKDQRSGLICAKPASHWRFLRSRVRRYCKNLEIFMACIFFSISGGKLEIVKVLHKTRIWDKLEAIWLFWAQTILRVPEETIGEEISR